MATPNLAITEVAAAQNQKEVTINEGFTALDNAITSDLDIVINGNIIISADNFVENIVFRLTPGTADTAFTITIPASKRLFIIYNTSGQTAILGNINIATDTIALLYTNGSYTVSVGTVSGGGGGGTQLTAAEIVGLINSNLGNTNWQSGDINFEIIAGGDLINYNSVLFYSTIGVGQQTAFTINLVQDLTNYTALIISVRESGDNLHRLIIVSELVKGGQHYYDETRSAYISYINNTTLQVSTGNVDNILVSIKGLNFPTNILIYENNVGLTVEGNIVLTQDISQYDMLITQSADDTDRIVYGLIAVSELVKDVVTRHYYDEPQAAYFLYVDATTLNVQGNANSEPLFRIWGVDVNTKTLVYENNAGLSVNNTEITLTQSIEEYDFLLVQSTDNTNEYLYELVEVAALRASTVINNIFSIHTNNYLEYRSDTQLTIFGIDSNERLYRIWGINIEGYNPTVKIVEDVFTNLITDIFDESGEVGRAIQRRTWTYNAATNNNQFPLARQFTSDMDNNQLHISGNFVVDSQTRYFSKTIFVDEFRTLPDLAAATGSGYQEAIPIYIPANKSLGLQADDSMILYLGRYVYSDDGNKDGIKIALGSDDDMHDLTAFKLKVRLI